MDRKLSAILAADVVGYSALMEADEKGTHERLKAGRKELFEPEIARHHGRIFKLMGDGMLAEFGSVVDAVECAVSMQRGLAERNAAVAQDQRVQVRIGINLGEVIVEGDDRYGEGVNIAARLEQLADPGGICVSAKVAREVEKKLAFGFEPMGAQQVKNIAEPVEAFRVKLDGAPSRPTRRSQPLAWFSPRLAAALVAIVAILGALAIWSPLGPTLFGARTSALVSEQGIPIIVVLPFEDLTGGQMQSGLGKGIAEQFITDLSTFPDFEVVSSTSSFVYAGTPIPQIVKATGARFIVEGSIRLAGDRVSVTVQLINGSTDRHLKTAQFEETMTDPVALQKTAAMRIREELGGMTGVLRKENEKIAFAKAETDLTEYDYYILGHVHTLKDRGEPAREVWEKGLRQFPESALLRYKLMTYQLEFQRAVEPAATLFSDAQKLRKRSRLDEWYSHTMSAKLLSAKGDHARAVTEARAAIAMAPYDALAHNYLSWVLINARLFDEAIEWAAFSLDHDPYALDWYTDPIINAYSNKMKWSEGIALAESRIRDKPSANRLWYSVLGAAYVRTGQAEKAAQAYKIFNSLSPPRE